MLDIFIDPSQQYSLLDGHHNPGLVIVSILVAIISSVMALQIAGMARNAKGRLLRQIALISGSLAMGGGIWSMHFIGMLAFQLGTHVHYSPFITLISMCPSVFASWVALQMLSSERISSKQLVTGGLLVGSGIGAMHYSGMAAMHMSATLRYDPYWFIASIFVAVIMAMISLWIRFGLRNQTRFNSTQATLTAGVIMGLAIAAMHYTGMGAARFIGAPDHEFTADNSHTFLAIIIGATTVAISLLVLAGNLILRYRQLYNNMAEIKQTLSSREQQYRTLIANIPGVAFRAQANKPWAVIFVSDAIATLSGWETEKFFSGEINLGDLVHPDDEARVTQELAAYLDNKKPYVIEYRIIRRDQSERWVSESASGIYDEQGSLIWIDGVIMDITESKLRNAEFEGVVRAIGHALAVVEFDLKGYILHANDNFLQLTGYDWSELVGRHHNALCLPEQINTPEYKIFWQELSEGKFQSGEFLRLGKNGKEIWIQAAYNPIVDADGKPWKIVKLVTDLSERKAMEMDLMIAKDKAEQASAAKGMFLANMSHEIRTPMNAIIGFTELLLDTPLQNNQFKQLQTVNQSARSLLILLNDILDTAKLERGALELDIDAFSLREVCQQIINELQIQAEKKHLQLIFDFLPNTRDIVLGDAMRLRQVLINLLGNAIKFTQEGTVTLEVTEHHNQVIFKVIDTGIGIAADRINHIFTPFTQADATMARRFGGTGLGTTIARQLTELMGGSIKVTSELGKGSCFEVSLALPHAQQVNKNIPNQKIVLPALRILIADDVPQNIEVLELTLKRDGHSCVTATNGLQAYDKFTQSEFDLVLMDIQMPEVDGLQACRIIRQWEKINSRKATPIIALTASVLEKDRRDASEAGMNGFASKPINLIELYSEIAECLGLKSIKPTNTQQHRLSNEVIDWHTAMQRWGDKSRLISAIKQFCRDNKQILLDLQNHDSNHIKQAAHRIKGGSANLGLTELTQLTARIEMDGATPTNLHQDIEILFSKIETDINLHQPKEKQSDLNSALLDVELLQRLENAYQHSAMDDDSYQQLAKAIPPAQLKPLEEALDQFDFDAALEFIRNLTLQLQKPET